MRSNTGPGVGGRIGDDAQHFGRGPLGGGAVVGLGAALLELPSQCRVGAQVGEGARSLGGQQVQLHALVGLEAPFRAFGIGVQRPEHGVAGTQRGHQAGALFWRRRAGRAMAQAAAAGAARFVQPRADRPKQGLGTLAVG